MAKKIAILGGVGNGSVIANAIIDAHRRGSGEWEFAGYLNDRIERGGFIETHPVLGKLDDWPELAGRGFFFINTIYRIEGQKERIERFERLGIPDERLAVFIHPLSYVAPSAHLEPGTAVMPMACISAAATIGKGTLVMVGAAVLHNTHIGRYCHLAAHSCVGANIHVGEGVHIGLGASVRENLTIGRNSALGMGAVLTKNMGENEIWVGNPARFLRIAT